MTTKRQGQHVEIIADFGISVAQSNAAKLNDPEFANELEDFFMACLELKMFDWAELFLKSIANMFPDGIKTMRLMAMWYES